MWTLWGCGQRGALSTKSTGLAASRWSRGQVLGGRRRGRREAGQALRSLEDGKGAVGILVPPDGRPDQVRPQRGRRDLQVAAVPADAVVVADPALFLDAQDVAPERLGHLDEDRRRLLGGLGEAAVVLGQIDLADEAVGGLDGGDPGFCNRAAAVNPSRTSVIGPRLSTPHALLVRSTRYVRVL